MNLSTQPSSERFQLYDLVVIGASAGGIEALSLLVATLPTTLPVPIVIAQHLDPHAPNPLRQILARRSALPVRTLNEAAPTTESLVAGTIYLAPSDHDIEITDEGVRLRPGVGLHPAPSIDRLFISAAETYGERVIAIVLTGSGSDGAAGARAIKEAGGTILIENPQTASYPAMPASLPPTSVDLIVDLERMGPLLTNLITGAQTMSTAATLDALPALLDQVRKHANIDFTQYNTPTILRRLHRRMVATGSTTLQEYLELLDDYPEEYQRLVASILVNVTEFFRDAPLFDYLREHVLPDLITRARTRGALVEIRVWSAGCSTGEEPYSIAMLLAEALGSAAHQISVRIFATDVDADAIAFARRGRFPASALANVPEGLRARYFVPVDGAYEIAKAIRSLIIFGEHDLGVRPPIPQLDMIICRDVLIYFTPELQQRALRLCAFALRGGGYLVLGASKTENPPSAYFGQVEPHLKIYRRQGDIVLAPPLSERNGARIVPPLAQLEPSEAKLRLIPNTEQDAAVDVPVEEVPNETAYEFKSRVHTPRERFADQILSLPLGVVVVDRNYDVLTINSAAYRLLDIYHPAIGKDLLHLAERIPTKPLRAAIDELFTAQEPTKMGAVTTQVELEGWVGDEQDSPRHLLITCYPYGNANYAIPGSASPAVEAVVLFISGIPDSAERAQVVSMETGAAKGGNTAPRETALPAVSESEQAAENKRLIARLEAARGQLRNLRAAVEELRVENDQLRQNNEVLTVIQEELESSSEKTKTLNEELQASNEELETLNEELEATVEELRTTNDELASRADEEQKLTQEKDIQR